jgi:DNA-binding transcriptional LysR family regulator
VLFTGKRNPERLTLVDGRGHAAQVRPAGRLRTNELRVARLAAIDGAGIAALPMVMLARDLAEERLVRVLPGWSLRAAPVHAVFPARTPQPARLTAFLDAMAHALRPSGRGRPDGRARGG